MRLFQRRTRGFHQRLKYTLFFSPIFGLSGILIRLWPGEVPDVTGETGHFRESAALGTASRTPSRPGHSGVFRCRRRGRTSSRSDSVDGSTADSDNFRDSSLRKLPFAQKNDNLHNNVRFQHNEKEGERDFNDKFLYKKLHLSLYKNIRNKPLYTRWFLSSPRPYFAGLPDISHDLVKNRVIFSQAARPDLSTK